MARKKRRTLLEVIGLVTLLALLAPPVARAETVRVRAKADPVRLYRGQSLQYQILIEGSDPDEDPDLSTWTDFIVSGPNRSDQSSHSIQIVNGRMNREVRKQIGLTYQLIPKRTGGLRIPAASVKVGGKVYRTRPIDIRVTEPQEREDVKLRLGLSKERCYVGEPVTLTLTWYFGVNIQGGQVQFSFFEWDEAFRFADLPVDETGKKVYEARIGPFAVKGVVGRGKLDGSSFTTLTFKKVILPRRDGTFTIDPAVLVCEVETGSRRGWMGFKETEKLVVPSNPLSLEVDPLPEAGRPEGFTGLIGEYRVETTAMPTDVNVGDPMILNIEVSGPEYLADVDPPDLTQDPRFEEQFKITQDTGGGRREGGKIIFSATIRARHSGVEAIPPVEIPYFDPDRGEYRIARSRPVPLDVAETKVFTLADAEGIDVGPIGSRIEDAAGGIAHNYEELEVLEDEAFLPLEQVRKPALLAALLFPPILYAGLAGFQVHRRRREQDTAGTAYRRAGRKARREIAEAAGRIDEPARFYPEVAAVLTRFIREKLRAGEEQMTSDDALEALRQAGVEPTLLDDARTILETCDAGRYGGAGGTREAREALMETLRRLVDALEKAL